MPKIVVNFLEEKYKLNMQLKYKVKKFKFNINIKLKSLKFEANAHTVDLLKHNLVK